MFEQLYLVGVYQLRRWTLGVWQFRPSLTYRSKHFSRARSLLAGGAAGGFGAKARQ